MAVQFDGNGLAYNLHNIIGSVVTVSGTNLDLSAGEYFVKTITGSTTFTLSNLPASGDTIDFKLEIIDGGAGSITWWSGVKWEGGIAPTFPVSGRSLVEFYSTDQGTTWSGKIIIENPVDIRSYIATIGTVDDDRGRLYMQNICLDSKNNVYAGFRTDVGSSDAVICKFNSVGELQWQKLFAGAYESHVTIDSNDNVYVSFYNSHAGVLTKLGDLGEIVWQVNINGTGEGWLHNMDTDADGFIYGVTYRDDNCEVLKISPAGEIVWQKEMTNSGAHFQGVAVSPSGNVYVCGQATVSGTSACLVVKYNSNGDVQWQKTLNDTGVQRGRSIDIDDDENVYVGGENVNYNLMFVAKYNSSGELQWTREITHPLSYQIYNPDVVVDGVGNIYAMAYVSNPNKDADLLFLKYNSSGTLQWQKYFGGLDAEFITYDNYQFKQIRLDSNNNIVFGVIFYLDDFWNDGIDCSGICRIGCDGSNNGGYNLTTTSTAERPYTVILEPANVTSVVGTTLADASASLTSANTTYSIQSISLTASTSYFPTTITYLTDK